MEAPPMEVFRWVGFAIGFALASWIVIRPRNSK